MSTLSLALDSVIREMKEENERLRHVALKAFTVVEWVVGEGFTLHDPHYDADDLLLDMVPLLGVENSREARDALTTQNHP